MGRTNGLTVRVTDVGTDGLDVSGDDVQDAGWF